MKSEFFIDDSDVIISDEIKNMTSEERRKLIARLEEEARAEKARIEYAQQSAVS